MRDYRDAKLMAKALREGLKGQAGEITHSQALELVARQFDLPDWNVLAAKIAAAEAAPVRLASGAPIIRILDEEKARAFYLDGLGFTLEWEHRFEPGLPLYAQIRRDDLVLHLSGHAGDATPGATVYVDIRGLDAFHAEIIARGATRMGIDSDGPGGLRTLDVWDPFSNRLRFGEAPADRGDLAAAGYSSPE
jgi:hypothetical protein